MRQAPSFMKFNSPQSKVSKSIENIFITAEKGKNIFDSIKYCTLARLVAIVELMLSYQYVDNVYNNFIHDTCTF